MPIIKFPKKKIKNSKDFYLEYINQKNVLLQNIDFRELNKVINLLKKCFKNIEKKETIEFVYPPKYMMNDNAAMIAWATILKHRNNHNLNFKANPRLIVE